MSSNYVGLDAFYASLTLITDDDRPSAAPIRTPSERLLDNTVHVRNRAAALETRATNVEGRATSLEGRATAVELRATNLEVDSADTETRLVNLETTVVSSVAALTTTTAATTVRTLATKALFANEAVAGTSYRYGATVQVARGSTATACSLVLALKVNGSTFGFATTIPINTVNLFTGAARVEGEITFHSAPGASASITATKRGREQVQSATETSIFDVPDLTQTVATNAPVTLAITANLSAAIAGVAMTPVAAYIERVKA